MNRQAISHMEAALDAAVDAGKMVCFTLCYSDGQERYHVSWRVALWLTEALNNCEQTRERGAVLRGEAVRVEFQDLVNYEVRGIYVRQGMYRVVRGLAHYCRRKYKDAMRKHRAQQRVQAKKGGQAQ